MSPETIAPSTTGQVALIPELVPSDALRVFLLQHPGVQFLRLQWQDHSGLLRARIVPIEHGLTIAAGERVFHVPPIAFHCIVDNNLLPELDPTGNDWLVPDWSSLKTRPTLDPLYANVMCKVVEYAPARPGPNWDLCPRRALETVAKKAEEMFGVYFLVGFEVEFEVMKASAEGILIPYSSGFGRFSVCGLRDPCYEHFEEAIRVLLAAGVKIDAFQTEGRRGQYELTLGCLPPLAAVDQLILVHDTLKRVFSRHGLMVTMSPRPVESRRQSTGQHTHISINPPHMQNHFLAGMLQRLPQLCAFCLPYEISYERVQPYLAGHLVGWGTENRVVPIRKIKAGHWEVRCIDATANMYLALAAILSAGLLGCTNKEPLLWPDTGIMTDPWPRDAKSLPKNIGDALDRLEENHKDLETMMESGVIQHYLRVKRTEAAKLRETDVEETRQLMNELF
ncbi:glutamine synthetase/guanido kinase [Trichoderma camerunense]